MPAVQAPASRAAQTLTVNTTDDNLPAAGECAGQAGDCSLRQALDIANTATGGVTIDFSVTGSIFLGSGPLDVSPTGGALAISGPGADELTIENTGQSNGGVLLAEGTQNTIVSGVQITGGEVGAGTGAGVEYTGSGTLTLDGVLISDNVAQANNFVDGVGAVNDNGSSLTIRSSAILGNLVLTSCGDGAGAIAVGSSARLTLINTTIAGNDVEQGDCTDGTDAGAIFVNGGAVVAINATIADNLAESGVAGLEAGQGSSVRLANTILAANDLTDGTPSDCAGTLTSQGYNLVGAADACTFSSTPSDLFGKVSSPLDPRLGDLDGGGPTPTFALLSDSPAIDAANPATPSDADPPPSGFVPCPTTDQIGTTRPHGAACDIGATEFVPTGLSTVYVDSSWANLENGTEVTGPDDQKHTIGTDAFGTVSGAAGAVSAAQTSDVTIAVAPGTYTDEGFVHLTEPGEELVGGGSAVTHLGLTQLSLESTRQVVEGLDLIGPGTWSEGICQGCGREVVYLAGDRLGQGEKEVFQSAFIDGNRISGGSVGIAFSAGVTFPSSGSEAFDNEIFHNIVGVSIDGGQDNTIDDNNLHDNGDFGEGGSGQPQASILILDNHGFDPQDGNFVFQNTIARTVNSGISVRTSNNLIENNTITDSGTGYPSFRESAGVELVGGSADSVDNNFVVGNTISGSAFAGVKIGFATDHNEISYNTVTGTLNGGADGSRNHAGTLIDPAAGGSGILITGYSATNTLISGNTLGPNTGFGILQEAANQLYGSTSGTTAIFNTINGNAIGGVVNRDPSELDATYNWWGAASGPSGEGPGSGDSVSTNVLFDPWLKAPPQAPQNDNFAGASPLGGSSGSIDDSNVGSTLEHGEPDPSGDNFFGNSVWYAWKAPADGQTTFTLDTTAAGGSQFGFGAAFAIYTGDSLDSLQSVTSSYDDNVIKLTFDATKDTTYSIQVGTYDDSPGPFLLTWNQPGSNVDPGLTLDPIANQQFGASPTAHATSSSPAPIVYGSDTPSICTVDPSTGVITLVDEVHFCTITAHQDAAAGFTAGDTSVEFFIGPSDQFSIAVGLPFNGPISGTVLVHATITGNDPVDHVLFQYFNGTSFKPLGTVVAPGPYQVQFDSTTVANTVPGGATLYAFAFTSDGSQIGAEGLGVTVQNATPGPPTNVVATPGDGQATVSWTSPGCVGGCPTSYTVTASPGGQSATVNGTKTSAIVGGLQNGTAYTFTVKATNASGDSTPSAPSNQVTPLPAVTYHVTTTADNVNDANCLPLSCTLREAIKAANAGSGADEIFVPAGTYNLPLGTLTISNGMTIVGAGARTTTIVGPSGNRVLDLTAAANPVMVQGFTLTGGTANANNGFFGGDVRSSGNVTFLEDTITGGSASSGGGLSNVGGTMRIERTTVTGNQALSGGGDSGGIQDFGDGTHHGVLTIVNSTISGNTARLGGGVFSWGDAANTTTIQSSTIAFNSATNRGEGGLGVGDGSATVENSILAGNTFAGQASNCAGAISSLGHNLETGTDCGLHGTGDLQSTDPQLGQLQNNGGPTDTHALASNSPALDAGGGDCPGTDQRGISRPQGEGCDLGAFELVVNRAPVAQDKAVTTAQDTALDVTLPANDPDGDPLTYSIVGNPAHGSLGSVNGNSVQYSPAAGYSGPDSFTFKANDGKADSNVATVSITVNHVNHAPAAVNDSYTTSQGTPLTVSAAGVLGNDTDPDGDALTAVKASDPTHGTVTLNANGSFTYTPTAGYSGPDSFTYKASDGSLTSNAATVSITVNAAQQQQQQQQQQPAAPSSPSIDGEAAQNVGDDSATVVATVNPNGTPTTVFVQYGASTGYGQQTGAVAVGSGTAVQVVNQLLSGLASGSTYHFRFVASNDGGTTFGPDATFTTAATPTTPGTQPNGQPLPPVEGLSVDVIPFLGTVLVNGVPLVAGQQIPIGSTLDLTKGTIVLVSIVNGVLQTMQFSGGIVQIFQLPDGTLQLVLENEDFSTCAPFKPPKVVKHKPKKPKKPVKKKLTRHTAALTAGSQTTVVAMLWGNGKGHFQTKGRYAAATVRGTVYGVTDRCDGTLITVREGLVSVHDFVRGVDVDVPAGQSYLVKP